MGWPATGTMLEVGASSRKNAATGTAHGRFRFNPNPASASSVARMAPQSSSAPIVGRGRLVP